MKQVLFNLGLFLALLLLGAGIVGITMYFQWLGRVAERNDRMPVDIEWQAKKFKTIYLDTACVRIQKKMGE